MAQPKNFALEGLRGIASLTVVIGHFTFVFFPYLGNVFSPVAGATPSFPFERWASYPPFTLLFSAEAAVCVFFVMSGYVLTTKYYATGSEDEVQSAAAKRYVRLVLPTFVSVMFAWILWRSGAIITGQGAEIGVAGWVPQWYSVHYSFLSACWAGPAGAPLLIDVALNPPAWTIQVELIGSVLLFSIVALFGKRPVLFLGWGLFFANALGFRAPNSLFYIAFFAGALLNPARVWLRSHQAMSMLLACVGLVGVAYNLSPAFDFMRLIPLPTMQPIGPDFATNPRLFWNTFGAIALVAGVVGSQTIDTLLGARPLVFLGRISFSMYLIHMPILMSLGLWLVKSARGLGMSYGVSAGCTFVLYLSTVIAAAMLFFRWIDKPSMRFASQVARLGWSGSRNQTELRPRMT